MSKKSYYWSSTRIDIANYCRMRYHLRYVEKTQPARLSAYAKGSLLHGLLEHFWTRLGTEEEAAKKKNKKKYFDAESFAKYAKGKWTSTVIGSKNAKNPAKKIVWRFDDEPYVIKSILPKICIPLFEHVINEGPPLFSELPFDFSMDDMRFKGFIDEVRIKNRNVVIRDYKSGYPFLGNMKVNHDPQLTFYNAGLCALCFADRKFAKKLGLEAVSDQFLGNPYFIYPEIDEEFFMIEALPRIKEAESEKNKGAPKKFDLKNEKDLFEAIRRGDRLFSNEEDYNEAVKRRDKVLTNVPSLILPTKRRDEHFFEVIKMIKGVEEAVGRGDIYPERGRKCDICDMKYACEKKLDYVTRPNICDRKGNTVLDFALAPYSGPVNIKPAQKPKKKKGKRAPAANQKSFAWGRGQNTPIGRVLKTN